MSLKFFYAQGACSLAPHIALHEAGADFEPHEIAFSSNEQRSEAYLKLNPKGRVPLLVDGDFHLTEVPALLYYIAQKYPDSGLLPHDLVARARIMEWCAFLSSSVHIAYAHVRRAERYATGEAALDNVRAKGMQSCREQWQMVENKLGAGPWAAGEAFSYADPYLFTFWRWGAGPTLNFDMAKDFPNFTRHASQMVQRNSVKKALATERLDLPNIVLQ